MTYSLFEHLRAATCMILSFFLIIGCTERESVEVVIVNNIQETTKWGCEAIDVRQTVRVIDGSDRSFLVCGIWGDVGDTLKATIIYAPLNAPGISFRYKHPDE